MSFGIFSENWTHFALNYIRAFQGCTVLDYRTANTPSFGGLVSSEQKLFCVNVCKNMQNQGMMIKEKTLSRLCKVSFQQQLGMLVKTYLVAGDNDLLTYINGNKSGKNNVPLMLECQHILSVPNRSPRHSYYFWAIFLPGHPNCKQNIYQF